MSSQQLPAPIAARRRISAFFFRRRWLRVLTLLIPVAEQAKPRKIAIAHADRGHKQIHA